MEYNKLIFKVKIFEFRFESIKFEGFVIKILFL